MKETRSWRKEIRDFVRKKVNVYAGALPVESCTLPVIHADAVLSPRTPKVILKKSM